MARLRKSKGRRTSNRSIVNIQTTDQIMVTITDRSSGVLHQVPVRPGERRKIKLTDSIAVTITDRFGDVLYRASGEDWHGRTIIVRAIARIGHVRVGGLGRKVGVKSREGSGRPPDEGGAALAPRPGPSPIERRVKYPVKAGTITRRQAKAAVDAVMRRRDRGGTAPVG